MPKHTETPMRAPCKVVNVEFKHAQAVSDQSLHLHQYTTWPPGPTGLLVDDNDWGQVALELKPEPRLISYE